MKIEYMVGHDVVPRVALIADKIAKHADLFPSGPMTLPR